MEVRAGLEEERTAEEGTAGNDNHTAALGRSLVDDGLYGLGLYKITVIVYNSVIGDAVGLAQFGHIDCVVLIKPIGNGSSVGELFFTGDIHADKHRQE